MFQERTDEATAVSGAQATASAADVEARALSSDPGPETGEADMEELLQEMGAEDAWDAAVAAAEAGAAGSPPSPPSEWESHLEELDGMEARAPPRDLWFRLKANTYC